MPGNWPAFCAAPVSRVTLGLRRSFMLLAGEGCPYLVELLPSEMKSLCAIYDAHVHSVSNLYAANLYAAKRTSSHAKTVTDRSRRRVVVA